MSSSKKRTFFPTILMQCSMDFYKFYFTIMLWSHAYITTCVLQLLSLIAHWCYLVAQSKFLKQKCEKNIKIFNSALYIIYTTIFCMLKMHTLICLSTFCKLKASKCMVYGL